MFINFIVSIATPLWVKCEDEIHTPKSGNLESSGSPKNSEHDCRGQNTLHWGFFYTIGKVLKCRRPKWPRMSHLDICSPSYGQKKGRESNWQFDSRPLKVGNRPESDVCRRSATWSWKSFKENYKISSDLIPIWGLNKKLWMPKVPEVQTGTVSGLLLGSPGKKCHSDVASAESWKEYYMGKVVASHEFGLWWVKWVQSRSWLVPTPKECRMSYNQLVGWFWMQDRITK